MSNDFAPTCPDCGDGLVYQPEPETSRMQLEKDAGKNGNGDWQCPDCLRWFDIPDNTPSHNELLEMQAEQEEKSETEPEDKPIPPHPYYSTVDPEDVKEGDGYGGSRE